MIGDRMLRRSMRNRRAAQLARCELVADEQLSAIDCISSALSSTGLPHHFSNSRKRGGLGVDL